MDNSNNSNTVYLLGDIHGEFGEIARIIAKLNKRHGENNYILIQLGDLGVGFENCYKLDLNKGLHIPVPNNDPKKFPSNFEFIRGNHDNPQKCKEYPNYLGDFGFIEELNIFYISGAASHDKDTRTEGNDWWPDEELSIEQFNNCIDLYKEIKPSIVISHEPPVIAHKAIRKNLPVDSSRTSKALQAMYEIWQPKRWLFGHHHPVWNKQIDNTQFTCVAINQLVKIQNEKI